MLQYSHGFDRQWSNRHRDLPPGYFGPGRLATGMLLMLWVCFNKTLCLDEL